MQHIKTFENFKLNESLDIIEKMKQLIDRTIGNKIRETKDNIVEKFTEYFGIRPDEFLSLPKKDGIELMLNKLGLDVEDSFEDESTLLEGVDSDKILNTFRLIQKILGIISYTTVGGGAIYYAISAFMKDENIQGFGLIIYSILCGIILVAVGKLDHKKKEVDLKSYGFDVD